MLLIRTYITADNRYPAKRHRHSGCLILPFFQNHIGFLQTWDVLHETIKIYNYRPDVRDAYRS